MKIVAKKEKKHGINNSRNKKGEKIMKDFKVWIKCAGIRAIKTIAQTITKLDLQYGLMELNSLQS